MRCAGSVLCLCGERKVERETSLLQIREISISFISFIKFLKLSEKFKLGDVFAAATLKSISNSFHLESLYFLDIMQ